MRQFEPVGPRFWAKVEKTETCWLWTGALQLNGYGVISENGFTQRAHRVSWELHYGRIKPGMDICHKCDVRACVRPDHLFQGTRSANMLDAKAKGRTTSGDRSPVRLYPDRVGFKRGLLNPAGRLTEEQVEEIRRRALSGQRGIGIALAREFKVGIATISFIKHGKRHK